MQRVAFTSFSNINSIRVKCGVEQLRAAEFSSQEYIVVRSVNKFKTVEKWLDFARLRPF